MQEIKCYEVFGNTDTTEGDGPMVIVARFSSKEKAELFVKSKHYRKWCVTGHQNWAHDRENIVENEIIILDSVSEFEELQKIGLMGKALSKLTKEEKEVLGLE